MSQSKLIPISYYNPSQETRLSAYADTIIYEEEGTKLMLRAIRFGGYPEMVQAMSDAIYAGATIEAMIGENPYHFSAEVKRYERQLSRDGVYAEATLLAKDDEQSEQKEGDENQQEQTLPPVKCIIFCPAGDRDRLFEELDRKTDVPLIPDFRDYVLSELESCGQLKKLVTISLREKIEAWVLKDNNIVPIVEKGLKTGAIAIPGEVKNTQGFDEVRTVTNYLTTFGVTVAERIRNQFKPLYEPDKEPLSPEILRINDYIREHAGYPLYDAQLAVAESVKRQLGKDKCAFIVAECGSGKSVTRS